MGCGIVVYLAQKRIGRSRQGRNFCGFFFQNLMVVFPSHAVSLFFFLFFCFPSCNKIFKAFNYEELVKKDIEILHEYLDIDRDGKISLEEFRAIISRCNMLQDLGSEGGA